MNLSCQVELKTVSDVFKDTGCWETSPAILGPSLYLSGTLLPADKYVDVPVRVMNVGIEPRTVKADTVVDEVESGRVGGDPELPSPHYSDGGTEVTDGGESSTVEV